MNKRNAHITLDRLSGMTYAALGEKWGISDARAHQIVRDSLSEAEGRGGVKHPATKATFGAWVTRMEARKRGRVEGYSPELFYWQEIVGQEERDHLTKRYREASPDTLLADIIDNH